VVSIDEATGEFAVVADIGTYEIENNPHPAAVDSNVYGMDIAADGDLVVADAGGNTVYHVVPATGELSVLAVIPGIVPPADPSAPAGTPTAAAPPELDAVPTGVAANPAGGVFVGLLSGGPFPPGAAKVVGVTEDGTVTDVATGLTMCTDVAIGPDGQMYAVQISENFLVDPPAPGSVVRVFANGTIEPVVPGLMLPNGIAFDAAGNLYIATGTVTPPGMDPAGMVLRIDGVAPPA
jgi:sugar lactone lactonase YvrE